MESSYGITTIQTLFKNKKIIRLSLLGKHSEEHINGRGREGTKQTSKRERGEATTQK